LVVIEACGVDGDVSLQNAAAQDSDDVPLHSVVAWDDYENLFHNVVAQNKDDYQC
jgi:hypothetical protein